MTDDRPAPVIAFFDIDNTLVRGATVYLVGIGAWRLRLVTLRDVVRFAWQQARFIAVGESATETSAIKDRTLGMIAGHSEVELRTLCDDVYDRQIASRLRPEVVARVDEHLARGDQVWLVSATAEIMSEVIAERLGATGGRGTRFETVDDRFTGRLNGEMLHGTVKAATAARLAMDAAADLADCWAYSDSTHDVPLLQAVGHPVVVRPDSRLKLLATENGWPELPLARKRRRNDYPNKRQNEKRQTTGA